MAILRIFENNGGILLVARLCLVMHASEPASNPQKNVRRKWQLLETNPLKVVIPAKVGIQCDPGFLIGTKDTGSPLDPHSSVEKRLAGMTTLSKCHSCQAQLEYPCGQPYRPRRSQTSEAIDAGPSDQSGWFNRFGVKTFKARA